MWDKNTLQKNSFKQVSFYLILVALPFILLAMLELILRVSSFGHEYPLFIQSERNTNYLEPNQKVINRYFSDPALAPKVSPDTVFFKKNKTNNSFRIFIQGGSTAAGFPYGRWGSLQGMLEQRFKRLYPDKEIEIINTAMAAVNSYTLLDFVDEIIEQQPDLVLIYAGHNEYLGIMGVGSAFAAKGGRLSTLAHLKLKNWRIYQLLQSFYYASFSTDDVADRSDKTLMAQIAKEKEIAIDSDLYQQGVEQFEANMSLILSKYQSANIPVVLGTLISNESDQVPFSTIESVDWLFYKKGLSKESAMQEIAALQDTLKQEKNAENYYKLALNFQLIEQYSDAKNAFVLAKDYDLLRFRAPSQFNDIIKSLAVKYESIFLDNQQMFASNSPQGIVGNKLILEHLHPTVFGYFLLAESYLDIINKKQLLGDAPLFYARDKAQKDIPLSIVDKLYGDFVISKLINDYPFTLTPKKVDLPISREFEKEALIKRINKLSWLALQKELLVTYQQHNEIAEAAKIAGSISTAMVDNHQSSYIAGQLYGQLNDWMLASYYHKKAMQIQPENTQYILSLAQDYFLLKHYSKSLEMLNKAKTLAPENNQIDDYINNVQRALLTIPDKQPNS